MWEDFTFLYYSGRLLPEVILSLTRCCWHENAMVWRSVDILTIISLHWSSTVTCEKCMVLMEQLQFCIGTLLFVEVNWLNKTILTTWSSCFIMPVKHDRKTVCLCLVVIVWCRHIFKTWLGAKSSRRPLAQQIKSVVAFLALVNSLSGVLGVEGGCKATRKPFLTILNQGTVWLLLGCQVRQCGFH